MCYSGTKTAPGSGLKKDSAITKIDFDGINIDLDSG